MSFAARLTDTTSDGVITGIGSPTVLIGGMPAAIAGDIDTPANGNPPAPFAAGAFSVLINGMPALRVSDSALNGAVIITGCTSVLIG